MRWEGATPVAEPGDQFGLVSFRKLILGKHPASAGRYDKHLSGQGSLYGETCQALFWTPRPPEDRDEAAVQTWMDVTEESNAE